MNDRRLFDLLYGNGRYVLPVLGDRIYNRMDSYPLFLSWTPAHEKYTDIPVCMKNLVSRDDINGAVNVYAPLFINGYHSTFRSGENLFCNLMSGGELRNLSTCIDKQGNKYYGGYGMILDKDFHPIIMKCERLAYAGDDDCTRRALLKISNKIYNNASKSLEKFILNKIIPLALRYSIFDRIEFSDSSPLIRKPTLIDTDESLDDIINDALESNIEAILRYV